ncbi:MAG: hypothetical protein AAGA54_09025 [Myxococcota bacterium]
MLALLAVLFAAGCGDPVPPRRPAQARTADKAALYGDPGLLPTRAGERARAEVALAGEIEASLALMHDVENTRATVTLDPGDTAKAASVVVRVRADADADAVELAAMRVATSVLSTDAADIDVQVSSPASASAARASDASPTAPLLLLAILGLGICLGLTIDRIRPLLMRSIRRPARRRSTHPGPRR